MWSGIFWKIVSCACFACINMIVRFLSGGSPLQIEQPLPIYVILFFQSLISAILVLPFIINKLPHIATKPTNYYLWHSSRIVIASCGIALWYLSLQKMPVPQVVAISFISPVITVVIAAIALKETLNINRKLAIACSFIGSFLITRPDLVLQSNTLEWATIFPVAAAFAFAIDKIITRKLFIMKNSPQTVTAYFFIFTTPLCLILAITSGWVSPALTTYPWLILLSLLVIAAHFTFNLSFAKAEVTVLMPYGITKIIFCSILSYSFFAEIPTTVSLWCGIVAISLSTIMLNLPAAKWQLRKANG